MSIISVLLLQKREENKLKGWNQLNDKFTDLSPREKWLISLGGLVGLFFIILTLLIDPALSVNRTQQQQVKIESSQQQRLQSEIEVAQQRLTLDPDREIDAELSKLSEQSQTLALKLSEIVGGVLTPSDMAELLEDVLASQSNLKLISLESLPAEPIITAEKTEVGYFVHPVRIELTGKYFDIQQYMAKLESMKVDYFWRDLHYQVETYPMARLVLIVHTLGTRQEFIGG